MTGNGQKTDNKDDRKINIYNSMWSSLKTRKRESHSDPSPFRPAGRNHEQSRLHLLLLLLFLFVPLANLQLYGSSRISRNQNIFCKFEKKT